MAFLKGFAQGLAPLGDNIGAMRQRKFAREDASARSAQEEARRILGLAMESKNPDAIRSAMDSASPATQRILRPIVDKLESDTRVKDIGELGYDAVMGPTADVGSPDMLPGETMGGYMSRTQPVADEYARTGRERGAAAIFNQKARKSALEMQKLERDVNEVNEPKLMGINPEDDVYQGGKLIKKGTPKAEKPEKPGSWTSIPTYPGWERRTLPSGEVEIKKLPLPDIAPKTSKTPKISSAMETKIKQAQAALMETQELMEMIRIPKGNTPDDLEQQKKSDIIRNYLGMGGAFGRGIDYLTGGGGIFNKTPTEVTNFKTKLMRLRDKVTRGETGANMPPSETEFYREQIGDMGINPDVLFDRLNAMNDILTKEIGIMTTPIPNVDVVSDPDDYRSILDMEEELARLKAKERE